MSMAACKYFAIAAALLALRTSVAAAVGTSGTGPASEPIEPELQLREQVPSHPSALIRTHPHHQHESIVTVDGGKLGALIESSASMAISASPTLATSQVKDWDKIINTPLHFGYSEPVRPLPSTAGSSGNAEPQAPAVGQNISLFNESQSPAIGQNLSTFNEALAPSKAVEEFKEAHAPSSPVGAYKQAQTPGLPVVPFKEAQAPEKGQNIAHFDEMQSPSIKVDTYATEAEAPAIGQEALREEHKRHNMSYGNYTGVVHFNIKVKGSGRYLRQDPGDDATIKAVSLASHDDAYARFRLVAETDGRWRIRTTATHHYWWEYIADKEVRGIKGLADTYTSFELEPQADWSYRIKVRGSGNYLHEDVTTGILAGGEMTDDTGSFIMIPLECCEKCSAYPLESSCPPDRCSWVGVECTGMRKLTFKGASAKRVLSMASAAIVLALLLLSV